MVLGRDVLLEVLRTEGVTHVFGNPGSTELPLIDALAEADDLQYVLGLQEATVVGMADGYAQATGRPAFLNLHTSAGLGNAVGNLTNARANRTPLVVTAGQQDYRHIATDPLLSGPLVELASGAVKWGHEVRTAGELGTIMRRAFQDAAHPPGGPVFASLPMDLLDADAGSGAPPPSTIERASVAGGLEELADLLTGPAVGKVAIVVGDTVAASGAVAATVAIAEALGAPVYGAPLYGRGVFPPLHPLWKGMLNPAAVAIAPVLAAYDRVLPRRGAGVHGVPLHAGTRRAARGRAAPPVARRRPGRSGVAGPARPRRSPSRHARGPAAAGASPARTVTAVADALGRGRDRSCRGGPGAGGHGPRSLRARPRWTRWPPPTPSCARCRPTASSSTKPSPPASTCAGSTTGPSPAATSSAPAAVSAGACPPRAACRSATARRPCCAWSATARRCTRPRRCGRPPPISCRWCSRWSTTVSTRS